MQSGVRRPHHDEIRENRYAGRKPETGNVTEVRILLHFSTGTGPATFDSRRRGVDGSVPAGSCRAVYNTLGTYKWDLSGKTDSVGLNRERYIRLVVRLLRARVDFLSSIILRPAECPASYPVRGAPESWPIQFGRGNHG